MGRGQTQSMCVGARMTERACMRDSESKRQKQSHGESGITVTEHSWSHTTQTQTGSVTDRDRDPWIETATQGEGGKEEVALGELGGGIQGGEDPRASWLLPPAQTPGCPFRGPVRATPPCRAG